MLLSAIAHLKRRGQEWRNVRLYGQERNLMTSAIARMNLFLHGVEDFRIERGDTLSEPKFVEADRLQRSDLVLANPPYSIKQWNREAFAADPWGRNVYGTPPQGRADYAFWQHILRSLVPGSGRCAILFPHGVLFRQEEAEMRRRLVEADLIECVIGLGPNLFYNSPMEACVLICRAAKPRDRRNKVLFINAVNEVTRERAQSFLTEAHIQRITRTYKRFVAEPGFAHVASVGEIRTQDGNLSIPMYVAPAPTTASTNGARSGTLRTPLSAWLDSRQTVVEALQKVLGDKIPRTDPASAVELDGEFFDRSSWQQVRLGDVVENVNETERDPEGAGIERFIGLENLEPGSLHVREWGDVSDGTSFTRRCRPGQVLFGKRRAYQRKLAVADFNAVVSGDIYVLQPKGEGLLPELLPFICLSDAFFDFAVGTSAGSLSPRTNRKHLSTYEFGLPPRDQQEGIAELLWSVDEAIEQLQVEAGRARLLRHANLEAAFSDLLKGPISRLSDLLLQSPESGKSVPPSAEETGHYVLSLSALSRSGYVRGNLKPVRPSAEILRAQLTQGDLLVSRSNTQELVGLAGIFDENRDDISFPDTMMRLSTDEARVCKEYLEAFLLSRSGRLYMMRAAAGTSGSMKKINRQTLGTCVVPTPSLEDQLRLMDRISPLKEVTVAAEAAAMRLRVVRSAIIEAAAGGVRLAQLLRGVDQLPHVAWRVLLTAQPALRVLGLQEEERREIRSFDCCSNVMLPRPYQPVGQHDVASERFVEEPIAQHDERLIGGVWSAAALLRVDESLSYMVDHPHNWRVQDSNALERPRTREQCVLVVLWRTSAPTRKSSRFPATPLLGPRCPDPILNLRSAETTPRILSASIASVVGTSSSLLTSARPRHVRLLGHLIGRWPAREAGTVSIAAAGCAASSHW